MMPATPPARLIITASLRNCHMHVLLRRAHGAAHADLLDALEDRREHDVHDPDAADDQRDRRDRAEHDVEDRLRALLLLEQQLGNADLEIGDVVVPALQHPAHHVGHGASLPSTCRPARSTLSSWL